MSNLVPYMKKLTTLIASSIVALALFAGCDTNNLPVADGSDTLVNNLPAETVTESNEDVTWQSGDVTGVMSEGFDN